MRTTQFEIPLDAMQGFAELLEEHSITNEITGTNGDGEIVVEVNYEESERDAIMQLNEFMDDYYQEEK